MCVWHCVCKCLWDVGAKSMCARESGRDRGEERMREREKEREKQTMECSRDSLRKSRMKEGETGKKILHQPVPLTCMQGDQRECVWCVRKVLMGSRGETRDLVYS